MSMSPSLVAFVLFSVAVTMTSSIQTATAYNGELRLYKKAELKQLRVILGVYKSNLCYDMPCAEIGDFASSATWTGLPAPGTAFPDGQAKLAFYSGSNCSGAMMVFNTSLGQAQRFEDKLLDKSVSSYAVLETSYYMEHASIDVCTW
jgi:hypothetical protein